MKVRELNDSGLQALREYLQRIRNGAVESPPSTLLHSAATSQSLPVAIEIEQKAFATKHELAHYLKDLLKPLEQRLVARNARLWSWLALFLFDQLAPPRADGTRKLLKENLYAYPENPRLEYRHLLYGPYWVFNLHGDNARLLLEKPLDVWSDLEEQLMGVQEVIRIKRGLEVVDRLYYDPKSGTAKRGVTNRKRGGTVRRLRTVLQQLDLTYDLYSMTSEEIVSLLPAEFKRFKPD